MKCTTKLRSNKTSDQLISHLLQQKVLPHKCNIHYGIYFKLSVVAAEKRSLANQNALLWHFCKETLFKNVVTMIFGDTVILPLILQTVPSLDRQILYNILRHVVTE